MSKLLDYVCMMNQILLCIHDETMYMCQFLSIEGRIKNQGYTFLILNAIELGNINLLKQVTRSYISSEYVLVCNTI